MSMPFDRALITMASDPLNFSAIRVFSFPRSPVFEIGADTPSIADMRVGDGSYRQDLVGDPLRNIAFGISPNSRMEGADLESWRLFRATGHMAAIFPNYGEDTYLTCHFEGNVTSEVVGSGAVQPVLTGGDASYVAGALGYALDFDSTQALRFDATAPATMSINLWLQFPSDASWGSLNGLYRAGVNHWLAWSHTSDLMRFRISSGNELDITAGQLPTLAAGEWFNLGISYTTGASDRAGRIVVNGDAAYTFDKTISADPTFDASWYVGVAPITGNITFGGVIDELRVEASFWTTDQHGAGYDRLAFPTSKILASQTQGQYFRVLADDMRFISSAQADGLTGAIRMVGGYCDPDMIPGIESDVWP